jgi:hypothetical protein
MLSAETVPASNHYALVFEPAYAGIIADRLTKAAA